MTKYIARNFEKKWQDKWFKDNLYGSKNGLKKQKRYILDFFPYPSGDGLHVGHFKGYTATDIVSRFLRSKGFNVLHPMGWDAFGLPAENFAIKTGIHPKITTEKNIKNIKRQMLEVGLSFDWYREINTTDPDYYKWTQWIFLKLFEQGLAYETEAPINFCPSCKTGLANEEVVNGKCERCGTSVEKKVLRQWVLRITKYADRLLEDLQNLDWPESIKDMQINWIGKSQGAVAKFDVLEGDFDIEVFSTRMDTLFGVTALVIAPEFPEIEKLVKAPYKEEVGNYLKSIESKTDLERTALNKEKTGVFTGSYAIHPINNERIPIWVADYVLGFYGSGAVMLVPAHDKRDFEFAKEFKLDIKTVISPESGNNLNSKQALIEDGVLINSKDFNDLSSREARDSITNYLKKVGKGDFKTQYKLRDWIFSRQRYWGEPIPIIHCKDCGVQPVPEEDLPVKLPDVEKYHPSGTGESPLANIPEFVNTTCPKCKGSGKRETNTMPQWAGSCWYYLRFIDPKNSDQLVSLKDEKYWLMVDLYVGGAEHAVLHLLYARFWHKFLFDIGVVSSSEPFYKLRNVGLVLSSDGQKMSKSRGNVITPDQIIEEYGADTLRLYEGFMGPFENTVFWDPTSISGVYRFLTKVWLIVNQKPRDPNQQIEIALNKLIFKVENDILEMKFNTGISAMMEFVNLVLDKGLAREQLKRFLIILAPFAPHITEEIWQVIGEKYSIHRQPWPQTDEKYLHDSIFTIVVQVNGKLRELLSISSDIVEDRQEVEKLALDSDKIKKFMQNKQIKKIIYIPKKILSIVV